MDRRQRKTKDAIFYAFTDLLSKKNYNQITVGEIINRADIGRATFYAHFETKDFLLREFCEDLFCHIFDREHHLKNMHHHIFDCDSSASAFVHLFEHLQKNDNQILTLLSSKNNEIFLGYFKKNLEQFIHDHISLFSQQKSDNINPSYWKNYIVTTLTETIKWWVEHGTKESPEVITKYFFDVIA